MNPLSEMRIETIILYLIVEFMSQLKLDQHEKLGSIERPFRSIV